MFKTDQEQMQEKQKERRGMRPEIEALMGNGQWILLSA